MNDILNSPQIFGPLTKLQCCPTSDGAAAAILMSERFVKAHGLESKAVEILGMEMVTDLDTTFSQKSCMNLVSTLINGIQQMFCVYNISRVKASISIAYFYLLSV